MEPGLDEISRERSNDGARTSEEEDAIRVRAVQILMLLDSDGTGTMETAALLRSHGGDSNGIFSSLRQADPKRVTRIEFLDYVQGLQSLKGLKVLLCPFISHFISLPSSSA